VKRFTVAATQVDVSHTDVEHNLEIHLQLIAEAAEAGCQLIVFPETSATGNNGSVEVTRFAEPHDGRIFETIRKQAKASAIVVSYGFCERFRGTHYNTSALVGPDTDDEHDPLETLEVQSESKFMEPPPEQLARAQVLALIEKALEKLPARQRQAFLLRYWEEMDVAEAAKIMGCSEGSVKTHCSRATHALAAMLEKQGIKL